MWWIDIIVAILLVLFAWVGWKMGFFSTLFSFVNSLVCFIAAFFLAKPFAMLLAKSAKIEKSFTNLFAKKYAKIGSLGEALGESSTVGDVLKAQGNQIKGVFKKITEWFSGKSTTLEAGDVPSQIFGRVMGSLLLVVISFIVLYISFRIIAVVCKKFFKKVNKGPKIISVPNKVCGLFLGLFKGFLFIGVVLLVCSMIPVLNGYIGDAVQKTFITKQLDWLAKEFVSFVASHVNINVFKT